MVENETVTGGLNRQGTVLGLGSRGGSLNGPRARSPALGGAERLTSSKLYADYLKREGQQRPNTQETTSSTREQREADEAFRDF